MLAKITSPKSLYNVLAYNMRKLHAGEASVIASSRIPLEALEEVDLTHQAMKCFVPSACRTKKIVFHASLNPHPEDKLTDEELNAMAEEYIARMGYGKQPYIVFKHSDIAREHLHIVSLRVDTQGKKLPHSFEARRSKRITDELELRYKLIPSSSHREQAFRGDVKDLSPINPHQGQLKEQIARTLRVVFSHYAFQSLGELNLLLARYQLTAEEVKRSYRGRDIKGLVYIALDEQGNKCSQPINASQIGRYSGYSAIQKHFYHSRERVKALAPTLRAKITELMKTSPTKEEFIQGLQEQGIETQLRYTDEGRLYGITFLSEELGIIANGSRLGKGYAARIFDAYFSEGKNPFIGYSPSPIKTQEQEEGLNAPLWLEVEGEDGDTLLDLELTAHDIDYKELAFQRRLRRKQKNKY